MPEDNIPGGGGAPQITPDAPEVKALIEKAVKEATSGLATNRDEILSEKKSLQQKLEEMSKTWEGLDPQAVRTIMSRLENDEEAKLLAEGKTDVVIERRTERLKADHQKQLEKLQQALSGRDQELETTRGQVKKLMVEGNLRQAAAELGLIPSAVEDALSRAMSIFRVSDDGKLIAEENGATVYGKDGKNPLTPAEWLETMKERAPHWFPAPSGAGAGGGSGRGGKHTITREQARNVQVYRAAKEAAEKAGATLQIVG
ncbi:minor structural protein [Pseudanabaena phage Pan1]|nr:minor structural protein [Pseudanabaena phage Pan1]